MEQKGLTNQHLDQLLQAGKIAAEALTFTCAKVKPGESLLTIVESGEARIRELGGQPAFPINISINHHAAHYTPHLDDTSTIPDMALVKIDLGVHVNGYIADNARTVIIGDDATHKQLVDGAEAGLKAAIHAIRAGIRIWTVSKAIADAMRKSHTRPIENLTGHSIEIFNLHAGISLPSVARAGERISSPRLKAGMVIAIEPFATFSKQPYVDNLSQGHIFGFSRSRNPSTGNLRALFSQMKVKFAQLPFTSRWLTELIEPEQIPTTLEQLQKEGCIHNYPVLGLRDRSVIAQAEHTVFVTQTGCKVITSPSIK
ncbi:MAG: type II methionyl aminopeptidase [Candidatus Thorarchaeota archaeon]